MLWFYVLFFVVLGALLIGIGYEITRICEAVDLYEKIEERNNEEDS